MKKILLSLVTLIIATGLYAQPLVYTPALKSPDNAAENQMPNVTVSWFAIAGSINLQYEVQIDTTASFNSPLKIDAIQTLVTGYTTDKLLFGTTYYWRVRAIDAGETSPWSEVWNFNVFSQVELSKPSADATDQEANVELVWKSTINNVTITGVTQYDYQIDTTADFNSPLLTSGTVGSDVFSYKNPELYFGQVYYWRVRAKHALSTSDWTDASKFTTLNKVTLQTPANNATNQMLDANIKWKVVGSAVSYRYQISDDQNFNTVVFEAQTDTNIVKATTLQFGVKYYWRVRARNLIDTTGWGTPNAFTTINTVILKNPSDLDENVTTIPTMSWTGQTGIVGFQLQIATDNNFANPYINAFPASDVSTYAVVKTLAAQTNYYWRMRAFSNGGILADTTDWSETWSFKTGFGLGIDDPSAQGFAIYPNPASGKIFVRLSVSEATAAHLNFIDLLGKTVLERDFDLRSGANVQEISLGDLRKGIYVARITVNGKTINQKVIVE